MRDATGSAGSQTFLHANEGGAALRPPIMASRILSGLAHRTWQVLPTPGDARCHAFLLRYGTADLVAADEADIDLSAPTLVWLPPSVSATLRLRAGCEGAMFSVAESLAWRMVAESAVGMQLRPLLTRILVVPTDQIGRHLDELTLSFDVVIRETRDSLSGSTAMINAHASLVMLHLWRASGDGAQAQPPRGAGSATVQRFRQLVELHYKEHIPIQAYAAYLGVTRSHLHDSCLRLTQRTPLAIVHERLVAEARLRLQQTSLSVEQIGYALGFRDPGYFSRFFKKASGQSPSAFRQVSSDRSPSPEARSFAAWP